MHSSVQADQTLRELAMSVARNEVGANLPIDKVLLTEGLTRSEFDDIALNPQYTRYVQGYVKELSENGYSFVSKARLLAEDLLKTAYNIAKDEDAPAAARVKMIENLVDWGGAVPKAAVVLGAGQGFSITINIPGSTPQQAALEDVTDVTDKATLTIPSAPAKAPTTLIFDEPDSYMYAGDDILT